MVFVTLLVAAVAVLSLSLLTVLRSSHRESQGSREALSALYACEAGLSAAVQDLVRGGTGNLGSANAQVAFGSNSYWVQSNDIGDGRTSLTAIGQDDRSQMGVELVVQRSSLGFFRWAAFGDEILHMDSNSRTDSYDSRDGTYASQAVNGSGSNQYASENGDVGSNADITMDSNNQVWGDAHPGPSGTVSGNLGNITGATTPLPEAIELPNIDVPVIPSQGPLTVNGADPDLPAGSYHYTTIQVNSTKTLTIHGPATVVCDNFKLKSNSQLRVDASNGPVEFYVIDDFVLNSNTQIASLTSNPLDLSINLLSDNILDPGVDVDFDEDTVDFDSGSKMFGTIFAPSAEITIDSNFELFGGLVARRVDLDSNCRIHYDEALADAGADGAATYQTLCWRLVPVP